MALRRYVWRAANVIFTLRIPHFACRVCLRAEMSEDWQRNGLPTSRSPNCTLRFCTFWANCIFSNEVQTHGNAERALLLDTTSSLFFNIYYNHDILADDGSTDDLIAMLSIAPRGHCRSKRWWLLRHRKVDYLVTCPILVF